MKRIGDVMRDIPVRPPSTPGGIVISSRETVKCPICQDAGYLRGDFPVGHPMFGRIVPCQCKLQEIDEREAGMFPFIREFKSLTKAIERFNRI